MNIQEVLNESVTKAKELVGRYGITQTHTVASLMANRITERDEIGLYELIRSSLIALDIAAAYKPWEIEHLLALLCAAQGDDESGELHHEMQRKFSHDVFNFFR